MRDTIYLKIKVFVLVLLLIFSGYLILQPGKMHADELIKGTATFTPDGLMKCSCPSDTTPHCGCLVRSGTTKSSDRKD